MGRFVRVLLLIGCVLGQGCRKDVLPLTWERMPVGVDVDLTRIISDSTGKLWIAGGEVWQSGIILRSEDEGQNWVPVATGEKQFLDLQPVTGGFLAAGVDVHLWHSVDGVSWQPHYTNRWNIHRSSAAFTPDRWVSVGGHAFDDGFMYIHDYSDAQDHYFAHGNRMNAVSVLSDQIAVAAGYGAVCRTEDQGRSWSLLDVVGDHFTGMHFPTPDVGYMAGYGGSLLKSTDGGLTWKKLRNSDRFDVFGPPFRHIHFRDEVTGMAVGDGGTAWLTRDGGASWQELGGLPGKTDWLGGLIRGKEVWVVGTGGNCYRALLP